MMIVLISSLLALFCSHLTVTQAQNTTPCLVKGLNEVLATNNYLLYGMTADCQLFFATNVPDGTDLGKQFGPSGDHRYNCEGARLFPIRNANKQLKLLMIFELPPTFYYQVFDFKMPAKGQWYSLTTGQNNGPVAACLDDGCTTSFLPNFTTFINANSQFLSDQILGFVYTDNSFNIFYRNMSSFLQTDMSTYFLTAENQLNLASTIPNVLTTPVSAIIADPYQSTLYVFDSTYMYRYTMSSMFKYNTTYLTDLNNYGSRDKLVAPYDGHSYNYYIANDILIHLEYPQPPMNLMQANIILQTIPTNMSNPVMTTLTAVASTCVGILTSANNLNYSSVDNFQMSILLPNDYAALVPSTAFSVQCITSILMFALVALTLCF